MNKISGGAATQIYQTFKSSALQYNCYNRQNASYEIIESTENQGNNSLNSLKRHQQSLNLLLARQ